MLTTMTMLTTTTTTMTTMVNFELVTFGLRLVFTHCLASGRELNNRIDQVLKLHDSDEAVKSISLV